MSHQKIFLGAAAYTVCTFMLAVLWHVMLFEAQYRRFGYFQVEPNFTLGLLSIAIQGLVLSFLYQHVRLGTGGGVMHGLKYALLTGVFFWTSHVLAFVAKRPPDGTGLFILMESVYLFLQFGVFGIAIGLIGKRGVT